MTKIEIDHEKITLLTYDDTALIKDYSLKELDENTLKKFTTLTLETIVEKATSQYEKLYCRGFFEIIEKINLFEIDDINLRKIEKFFEMLGKEFSSKKLPIIDFNLSKVIPSHQNIFSKECTNATFTNDINKDPISFFLDGQAAAELTSENEFSKPLELKISKIDEGNIDSVRQKIITNPNLKSIYICKYSSVDLLTQIFEDCNTKPCAIIVSIDSLASYFEIANILIKKCITADVDLYPLDHDLDLLGNQLLSTHIKLIFNLLGENRQFKKLCDEHGPIVANYKFTSDNPLRNKKLIEYLIKDLGPQDLWYYFQYFNSEDLTTFITEFDNTNFDNTDDLNIISFKTKVNKIKELKLKEQSELESFLKKSYEQIKLTDEFEQLNLKELPNQQYQEDDNQINSYALSMMGDLAKQQQESDIN